MPFRRSALCIGAILLIAGCSGLPRPYRMDVRQGNLVTQDLVDQLKPGMTREQVRFLLGTPMVADIFHASRWDYVYQYRRGWSEVEQRRLTVFFRDDRLDFVAGDVIAKSEMKEAESAPQSAEAQGKAGAADSAQTGQ